MNDISLKIIVFGKVQGVWFRKNTQRKARELCLVGFVKNLDDGSVYIEVQGKLDAVKTFQEWCGLGPSAARVDKVEVTQGIVLAMHDFSIR